MSLLEKLLSALGLELKDKVDTKLNDKIYIRVNSEEKILIQKYAELKGTTTSKLIRDLINKDINTFIIQADNKYNFRDINY